MRNAVALILGGGKGTRLFPLTQLRSKPAVPLAAKYRLIDIPISNCLNSGINHIYVLTQFLSVSLHRHIRHTYTFDQFSGGFVELLAAQQTDHSGADDAAEWYQGTADAVRKNLRYFDRFGIDYVLILSGDQLYRMDFQKMLETHIENNADVTIAALPVDREQASGFGIMRLDDSGRVIGFVEKPKTEEELATVRTDPAWLDSHGIESRGRDCLASMGIYLFDRKVLVELLESTTHEDFGKEVFPTAISTRRVQMHPFDGYWEDIGTIRSFYEANLALASETPPFQFVTPNAPIYTRTRYLPPSRIRGANCRGSLISDGCVIEEGAVIENSVIGLRCVIGRDVQIRNSIVMGADFYEDANRQAERAKRGIPAVGIGAGSRVENAIVDKNVRVGEGAIVVPPDGEMEVEFPQGMVRDGIICLGKNQTLPANWEFSG